MSDESAERPSTAGATGTYPSALLDALGRAWTDRTAWEFLTEITAIGSRMAGSSGERRAAEAVARGFRDAGVAEVTEETFELTGWTRGESTLELLSPRERPFETIALPYSPSGEVTGELVDVGYGTPGEIDDLDVTLEGQIAVASTTTPPGGRFIHRVEKFGYAIEQGAEAFVFANHVDGQLPPTGALTFGEEALAPAVGVSSETGTWLREYAVNTPGEAGQVRLAVEASTAPGTSRNIVGRLGPDTDGTLLLLAHYDAHDIAEGALDNGCGITTVVETARILSAVEDELSIGVRVAGVGCEEVGLLGAEELAERLDLTDVHGVINVDGAGRHRNLVAYSHGSEATAGAARAVSEATRQPIEIEPEPHPFSDQWPFVRRGVPALQLHSDSGERGRGWGHTHADTRDKVDDRNVREHAMLTALLAFELGERELPRLDDVELSEAFREADFEVGMRAAGLWPEKWE
ncbi:peptidase M28 [Halalkaliarchaeum desulfuricum]|uniref:Carboxypeptidase Q n=1 Tax=Halalkaliarchaeum desulfuricum TaxID=2055893 RepID=A0A343TFQ7_9EURY|nr:M28 family metallopeptidase [Halalkaliarchaeum desulfuricum]AUX07929.1 peptidase M28 [Halalkaliarchaeum desulfuricum]